MTPLQLAKDQCSNYREGACSGIGIEDDGSLKMFGAKPRCVLALDQPCKFFEHCVIPMHINTNNAIGLTYAKQFEEAKRLYRLTFPQSVQPGGKSGRVCPSCNRRELERGKRFCYVCREAKRKADRHRD